MKPHTSRPIRSHARQAGFSLLELSMVLIVVALIAGALAVGADIQRNAAYQRLGSSFIRGWQLAFMSHVNKVGIVIADNATTPTGLVNANTTGADGLDVCGPAALRTVMLAAGVEMPQGRSEGLESYYSYLDSNGNPQELEVCFRALPWMVESGTPGVYENQVRNVMVIKRVTPDLARLIDSLVDNGRDAQFGKVRQYPSPPTGSSPWASPSKLEYSLTNLCVQGGGCSTALDEAQVATLTLYYLMDN